MNKKKVLEVTERFNAERVSAAVAEIYHEEMK